jgi:hypothetical protein
MKKYFKPSTQQEIEDFKKYLSINSPTEDIRDYIVIPQKKEDWLFYGSWTRIKSFFSLIYFQTKRFSTKEYWSTVNTIEALSFATKICIIFPGLLLGKQWWWL